MADKIKIKHAKLIYKNFSGKPDDNGYNAEGERNFGVILDEHMVDILVPDGWYVKRRKPREDDPKGYKGQPYLKVKVKYGKNPPIVELFTSEGESRLYEDTISQLDWTRVSDAEVIIRPYEYKPGKISAYLQSLKVIAEEDRFYDF